jgi:uncharacterized membrane protein
MEEKNRPEGEWMGAVSADEGQPSIVSILFSLDAFVLGGLVTLILVRQLIDMVAERRSAVEGTLAVTQYLTGRLQPFFIYYGLALAALAAVTGIAIVWLTPRRKARGQGSSRPNAGEES